MSRLSLLPRKFKKLFAVLLCYLLLLGPLTPAASAGSGWETIGRGRVSMRALYLASASLNRSVMVGTVRLSRFLLLEIALVWIAPGAGSSSHLSLFQGRDAVKARAPEGTFPVLGEVPQEQLPLYTPVAIPSTLQFPTQSPSATQRQKSRRSRHHAGSSITGGRKRVHSL